MPLVRTDLRDTRPRAKEISYSPKAPVTARNVQDAIGQVQALTGAAPPAIVPVPVTFAQSPYAVQPTDYLLYVDTAGGAITITMPLAATRNNLEIEIKDSTGHASANAITIATTGGENIDGLASYPIATDFGAVRLKPKTGGYTVI